MRKIVLAVSVVFSASALAQPAPTECRFKGEHGKQEVRCRVELGAPVGGSPRVPQCFPVQLEVRCDNDFDLEDRTATSLFRNSGLTWLTLGIEDDRTAVLRIDVRRGPTSPAELTIREDDEAVALEGVCRNLPTDPEI